MSCKHYTGGNILQEYYVALIIIKGLIILHMTKTNYPPHDQAV